MNRKLKFISVLCLSVAMLFSPSFMSGTISTNAKNFSRSAIHVNSYLATTTAAILYDSLKLNQFGLNEAAFKYAWKGYRNLLEKGKLKNPDIISICDFSQSSKNKRLYIIDLLEMKVSMNTYVAHGKKSGGEFAKSFSNSAESHKSSLGFYITGQTYFGQHGLSLKIQGIEKGFNDKAMARRIVVHGSEYVGDNFLENYSVSGRSYGCPAVPSNEITDIINTIKEGSCLFIYYPSKKYLTKSKILNG